MGGKLCKHSSSERMLNAELLDDDTDNSSHGSCISQLLKPDCFEAKKTKKKGSSNPLDGKDIKVKKLTLEDWLLASPGLRPECMRGGELCVLKNMSKRVHPSSNRGHESTSYKGRPSFSLERLVILDREAKEDHFCSSSMDVSSISRSKSETSKKRVSFKLPEEADVIIFYSPKESLESEQDA